jgi:hypothetical protein
MRGYVSIDVDIEDVISELSNSEKQELVDDLFKDGYIAKGDKRNLDDDFDIAVEKLIGNKHRLTLDEESIIFTICNRL